MAFSLSGAANLYHLDYTSYPTRPECFGQNPTNSSCVLPSQSMIEFLNITDPSIYQQMYCLSPPDDSCAFGYCPNPDIASPVVRIATYVNTICLSILLLYQRKPAMECFYGLVVQNYALMVAVIISLARKQLTRLHAMFALTIAGSPLSIYLLAHAIRSIFFTCSSQLKGIFGKDAGMRRFINRAIVFAAVPLWIFILACILHSPKNDWFSQTACDDAVLGGSNNARATSHARFHDGSFELFIGVGLSYFVFVILPIGLLILLWFVTAWTRKREEIRQCAEIASYPRRVWKAVTNTYPVMRFLILIALPFANWVLLLEAGSKLSNEYFTPTLGQMLVVSAAVLPFAQCMTLLPRLARWFINLTWVRFLTCRSAAFRGRDLSEDRVDRFADKMRDTELAQVAIQKHTTPSFAKWPSKIHVSRNFSNASDAPIVNLTSTLVEQENVGGLLRQTM